MKKKIISILTIGALAVSLAACGNSGGSSADEKPASDPAPTAVSAPETSEPAGEADSEAVSTPAAAESTSETTEASPVDTSGLFLSTTDIVKEVLKQFDGDPNVFFFDASETFEEYQIYYENGEKLSRLIDLCCFSKDVYPKDYIESQDISSTYPGFDEMDFAYSFMQEYDNYYAVIIVFDDLTDPDHVEAMTNNGLIMIIGSPDNGIPADSYRDLLERRGCIRLDPQTMEPMES